MPKRPQMALVVACARNGVIGKDGRIPWHLSSDLKHFKALTLGKPVIMGRKTWESLPRKPLSGRLNIVLSRDLSFEPQGAVVCDHLSDALSMAKEQANEDGKDEIYVIGGAEIYRLALEKADRLYITEVDLVPEGDAFFPDYNLSLWELIDSKTYPPGDGDDCSFALKVFAKNPDHQENPDHKA